MKKATIAAVAICKNEEVDLPGFLSCLLPWVDEIIIVDDGSTDDTLMILQAAGDKIKVVSRKMEAESGFAGQRNAGIETASSDWLLHMDIDERITPQLADEIKKVIQDTSLNAFCYRRLNYFLHHPMKFGGWQYWNKPQLARRGSHHFENVVHEECVIAGGVSKTGQLENYVHHLVDDGYVERVEKI